LGDENMMGRIAKKLLSYKIMTDIVNTKRRKNTDETMGGKLMNDMENPLKTKWSQAKKKLFERITAPNSDSGKGESIGYKAGIGIYRMGNNIIKKVIDTPLDAIMDKSGERMLSVAERTITQPLIPHLDQITTELSKEYASQGKESKQKTIGGFSYTFERNKDHIEICYTEKPDTSENLERALIIGSPTKIQNKEAVLKTLITDFVTTAQNMIDKNYLNFTMKTNLELAGAKYKRIVNLQEDGMLNIVYESKKRGGLQIGYKFNLKKFQENHYNKER